MERDIKDICKDINSLNVEIQKYITDTENWLLYWMANKEVQDFIREYPNDFMDKVSLSVDVISNSAECEIRFFDHPNDIHSITRYCVLSTFRDVVKAKYREYKGDIKSYKRKELEKNLEYFKEKVKETENELKELEL